MPRRLQIPVRDPHPRSSHSPPRPVPRIFACSARSHFVLSLCSTPTAAVSSSRDRRRSGLSAPSSSIRSTRASEIALSLRWVAFSARVSVFCSSATRRNVMVDVKVLITSAQPSMLGQSQNVGTQISTSTAHTPKNHALETRSWCRWRNGRTARDVHRRVMASSQSHRISPFAAPVRRNWVCTRIPRREPSDTRGIRLSMLGHDWASPRLRKSNHRTLDSEVEALKSRTMSVEPCPPFRRCPGHNGVNRPGESGDSTLGGLESCHS